MRALASLALLGVFFSGARAEDRVMLVDAKDGGGTHLVVIRNETPVLDRPLRNDLSLGISGGEAGREAIVEEAPVALDGSAAVVLVSRYSLPPARGEQDLEDVVRIDSVVTWIDPEHPSGRWNLAIPPGLWVQDILVLPRSRGVAVATSPRPDGEAGLHVYDATGAERFGVSDLRASVVTMVPASHGGFFAVDLAYVTGSPGRDRAILVIDMLKESRWSYTWSYGDDFEPVSWELLDTGILTLDTPGGHRRYDRNGLLLEAEPKKKKKKKK